MPASVARMSKVSDAHASTQESLVLQLIKLLLGLWGGFEGWRDPILVAGQAAASAQMVDAATSQSRRLTRAYLQSMLTEMNAAPTSLPAQVDFYPRANVSAAEVYERPAKQFVYALSQGKSPSEALQIAEDRLRALAESDVQAAARDEQQRVLAAAPKVIGYRRVIHPELSKTGTCGLCIVASQRLYHVTELMPLHFPTCHCVPIAVIKGDDPGFRLNDDDLKAIYAAAGGNAADELRQVRISINEHGELGPILTKEGDHFRDASDAGAPKYVRPNPENSRTRDQGELDRIAERIAAARKAFDDFVLEHPRDTWDSENGFQQRAYELQRALGQLTIRQSSLQSKLSK